MDGEEATKNIIGIVPVVVSMKVLDKAMDIGKRKPAKIKVRRR